MGKSEKRNMPIQKEVENPDDDDIDSNDDTVASRLTALNGLLVPDRALCCTDYRS